MCNWFVITKGCSISHVKSEIVSDKVGCLTGDVKIV